MDRRDFLRLGVSGIAFSVLPLTGCVTAGPSLIEHEFDHVFIGRCNADPSPDPAEIAAVKWMPVGDVLSDVAARPERYSAWFSVALVEMIERAVISRGRSED